MLSENEKRQFRADEAVKVSFQSLQIVVRMIKELSREHGHDEELRELSDTLCSVAHKLYGNVTCMKLANGWPEFDRVKQETLCDDAP